MLSRQKLIFEIEQYVSNLVPLCPTMTKYGTEFAVLGTSDGDSCLFNGLLATLGYAIGEAGVKYSQAKKGEPMAGMYYRSPIRRSWGKDLRGHKSYFSRDMALGVLAYYISTKDTVNSPAENWLKFIDKTRPCKVKKPKWAGGGCLLRGLHTYAPDYRSTITPTMWAIMHRVWSYKKWKTTSNMNKWEKCDGDTSVIEAKVCDLGYKLHLKVIQAYLKSLMGVSQEYVNKVSEIAFERIPGNLFYEFMARKRMVTNEMLDRYLQLKPELDQNFGNSWTWEKSEVTETRIQESSGWDFVFLGSLFTNPPNLS